MVAFLNAADISEQIDELTAKAEAIYDTAKAEDRVLSDEESAELIRIQGDDGAGGELAKLYADQKTKRAIEQRAAAKLQARLSSGEIAPQTDTSSTPQNIVVPARAKATHKTAIYDTERDAYIAGHVFLAGIYGSEKSRDWCNNNGFSAVMSTTDNSTGGFLTTEEMSTALIRLREERGVFPQFARNWPMGADTLTIPRILADNTAYWVAESAEITASDPTLGQAELLARKLACLNRMPTELDEDSVVDIGNLVTQSMAYAMADKVDEAGFNGDGTTTYGGIVGLKNALTAADPSAAGDGAVVVAETGNDAASNLDLLDFEKTMGALPEYPGINPRWFMSKPVFWASYGRLQQAAGGNTVTDLGSGPVPMIGGYPVTFVNVMTKTTSTAASTIIAYFGDLGLAASYGTRRASRVAVSTERYFELDQIGIKSTERLAITVHERGDDIRQRPILALKTAA